MKERLARKASKVGVLLNKEKAMLAAESGKLALEVEATKKLEARLADERKKSEAGVVNSFVKNLVEYHYSRER